MILAVIQARMSSKRLPGKVLMEINGKPMLQWVIEAAQAAKMVDRVVVATSDRAEDNELFQSINAFVDVYRGSLDDVLGRFYRAALFYKPSHIVRLTGDCPMLKPEIIDATIRRHLEGNYDYTCNFDFPTVPNGNGLDVEVFTMDTLLRAAKLATSDYDREHVTPFMRTFRVGKFVEFERPDSKLSVDTQEEFEKMLNFRGHF